MSKRVCEIISGSVGHTEQADDDGAYDLHDERGTPQEIGKKIAESLQECDLFRGGAWSYLENGQPIFVSIVIRIEQEKPHELACSEQKE